MSEGRGRVERVRTDAGWHGRVVAANGEPTWTTEVYTDPRHVENALSSFVNDSLGLTFTSGGDYALGSLLVDVDER